MDRLYQDFYDARLPLELRTVPFGHDFGSRADSIVQMDIARANEPRRGKIERFRIYPGLGNRLDVVDLDGRNRQLVLHVVEQLNAFTTWVRESEVPAGAVVVGRKGNRVEVQHWTSSDERTFLLGQDEQHLFIALLPSAVGSVRDAHAALRPALVDQLCDAGASVTRQGEWFFMSLSSDEQAWIDELARKTIRVVRKTGIADAMGLRRLGRQHVADEVVVVRGIPAPDGDRSERVYVRGAIVHPDHRTVVFKDWRRTIVNNERLEEPVAGVDWID
ncbi:MAG: hypothetical protein HOW73_04985 [Polyangiaceae bacterium]|nr:hypothetical protein [Polyangiaceae bacterium]